MIRYIFAIGLLIFTFYSLGQVQKNSAAKMFEYEYDNLQRNFTEKKVSKV